LAIGALLWVFWGVLALLIFLAICAFGLVLLIGAKIVHHGLSQVYRVSTLPRTISRPLNESRYYGSQIVKMAQQYPPGPMKDRLNLTLQPVDLWLNNLTRLEQGLSKLHSQRNLTRELRQTSFEIEDLRRRLLSTSSDELGYLRDLKRSKEQQLAVLQELQRFQIQAEYKIRKIASDLAVTHAEMLLIVAKGDFNENRMRRLDENLQEHLSGMRDILAAMDDMGYSRAATGSV
jgi:hypothetical protein